MQLISVKELARKMSCPPTTIYTWVRAGQIPHYKIGKNVRFDVGEIEAWLLKWHKPVTMAAGGNCR